MMNPHLPRSKLASITFRTVLLSCLVPAAWAQSVPSPAELASTLREQQQQIERQRAELEQQRQVLEQQARQLEALAAALDQRLAAPASSTVPAGSAAIGHAGSAGAGAAGGAVGAAAGSGAALVSTSATPAAAGTGLRWAGYGEMSYQRYDFYKNVQTEQPERRGKTDIARFVLAPSYNFGRGWSFGAEIEIEHGGTGATIEYEAEEAGEFEAEVEKGGEVVLEQFFLQYSLSPALNVRFGELVVPVGMVNRYHQPSEYFSVERSLAETSLIPSVWHETGIELLGTVGQLRYGLQAVTALDSTGFSGYEFVRGGTQRKLEFKNADAFAFVAHAEYGLAPGVLVGAAFYSGDSAPNRPRQNLDGSARVTLAEVHARYGVGPLTLRGQYLEGRVQNAAAVTQANLNTYNGGELGTSRTPVGSKARSYFVEAGYDLFSLWPRLDGRLDLFGRYDFYDTHGSTAPSIARIARYQRKAYTVGLNYRPLPGIVIKGEVSRRLHAGTFGSRQTIFGLAAGLEF